MTSTSAAEARLERPSNGGAGANTGRVHGSGSVTYTFACATAAVEDEGGKKREANGGGCGDDGPEDEEAAGPGYSGSGSRSGSQACVDIRKESFLSDTCARVQVSLLGDAEPDTDEPSLESRVADNLKSLLAADR